MNRGSRGLAALAAVLVLTSACSSGGSGADRSKTGSDPTPTQSFDPSTKEAGQKALDGAFDLLKTDSTGSFSTWVSLGESEADEIDVTGSFDLTNHLLETLTQFPAEDVEGGVAGVRSKVIDKEIFAGPDFGPYKECWFKYTSAAIGDIIGAELPVDTGSAWIPSAVALVTDAHALGSTARGDYEIRAKVSAQLALAAISQKFAAKKYKILPDEEVRAIGTITLRNGVYDTLTVRGEDVVNALKKAGVDLFKGEAMGVETFFRTAKMVTTFESFGALVTVERPAPRTIVEMKGNDQVNSGQTTCTQATS